MGGNLIPYGKGDTPKLHRESFGGGTLYSSNTSFNPIPAENEKSIIDKVGTYESELEKLFTDLEKNVNNMKTEFGTKFISINGEALGFVDESAFKTVFEQIKAEIETMKSELETFFSACSEGEEKITRFLTMLSDNNSKRNELIEEQEELAAEYNNGNPSDAISNRLDEIAKELSKFIEVPDPTQYGKWQW